MIVFCVIAALGLFIVVHLLEGALDGMTEHTDNTPIVDKWRNFGKRVGREK